MAVIKMIKYHALPLAKARQVVQKAADDLGEEYNLTSEWRGDTLCFHRAGVEVAVGDRARPGAEQGEGGLLLAVVATWVSGLDYARVAPRVLRGERTAS